MIALFPDLAMHVRFDELNKTLISTLFMSARESCNDAPSAVASIAL